MKNSINQIRTTFFAVCTGLIFNYSALAYEVDGVTVEHNKSRPGSSYTIYKFHSVDECARKCAEESRCQSYDYEHVSNGCALKDSQPRPVYKDDWISGVKRTRTHSSEQDSYAKSEGRCKLVDKFDDKTVFKGRCEIIRERAGDKTAFLIKLDNGTKYHFVGKGHQYELKTGWDRYDVEFKDKGDKGVFKWDDNKLVVEK